MKRVAVILSLILLLFSCNGGREEKEHPVSEPVLSTNSIEMNVGETKSVEILNLERGSASSISVIGGDGMVNSFVAERRINVTALRAGECSLSVRIATYPALPLRVKVKSIEETASVFADATPRFEGVGTKIDGNSSGVLVYRIDSPLEWVVHNLIDHNSVSVTENRLTVNQEKYDVESLEVITDKSNIVNYIRITLKNNQEAWLVILKEE